MERVATSRRSLLETKVDYSVTQIPKTRSIQLYFRCVTLHGYYGICLEGVRGARYDYGQRGGMASQKFL